MLITWQKHEIGLAQWAAVYVFQLFTCFKGVFSPATASEEAWQHLRLVWSESYHRLLLSTRVICGSITHVIKWSVCVVRVRGVGCCRELHTIIMTSSAHDLAHWSRLELPAPTPYNHHTYTLTHTRIHTYRHTPIKRSHSTHVCTGCVTIGWEDISLYSNTYVGGSCYVCVWVCVYV